MSKSDVALVTLGDVYSKILDGPARCNSIARTVCRARPDGYQYMPKYKSGHWDGYITLMRGINNVPTGLLPMVQDAWNDVGIAAAYSSQSVVKIPMDDFGSVHDSMLHDITLRDYQVRAILAATGHGRGIIKMATGSGKTIIIAGILHIARSCASMPVQSLVVVNSRDLLYQTANRISELLGPGISAGKLGDSITDIREHGITVATVQTLHARGTKYIKQHFRDNRVLIVDECHHISHNKTFDILMSVPGWHRYGTSGTPLNRGKLNDLKLVACTGSVHVNITTKDLSEDNWLAKPIIHMHDVPEPIIDTWDWPYQDAYDTCIVENEMRNSMIEEIARAEIRAGRSVLIIVTRIAHGKALWSSMGLFLNDAPVVFVNGSSSIRNRNAALSVLDRQPCVVIATTIFDEGVDVPGLDAIIVAAGGASQIKTIQRIGRGLRPKVGRNEVHIHDFIDAGNEYLLNHSESRLDTYEQEGFEVRLCSDGGAD